MKLLKYAIPIAVFWGIAFGVIALWVPETGWGYWVGLGIWAFVANGITSWAYHLGTKE